MADRTSDRLASMIGEALDERDFDGSFDVTMTLVDPQRPPVWLVGLFAPSPLLGASPLVGMVLVGSPDITRDDVDRTVSEAMENLRQARSQVLGQAERPGHPDGRVDGAPSKLIP